MKKAFDVNVPRLKPRLRAGFAPPMPAPDEVPSQADDPETPGEVLSDLSDIESIEEPPEQASVEVEATGESEGDDDRGPVTPRPESAPAEDPAPPRTGVAQAAEVARRAARRAVKDSQAVTETSNAVKLFVQAVAPDASDQLPPAATFAAAGATIDAMAERKARLERVKRRVAQAVRPTPRVGATPPTPAAAGESAMLIVHDLED